LCADVRTTSTLPVEVSAELGTYVALSAESFGVNVPLPSVVQVPALVTVTVPLSEAFGVPLQIIWSGPAFAVGAFVIVTLIVELAPIQVPFPVVASVKVRTPVLISAALGVYVAFKVFASGVKVPVPVVVQVPPVAPPVMLPFRLIVALFAQTDWLLPALAPGASVIVTVSEETAAGHEPLLVDVSVNTTLPAAVSALLGVYVAVSADEEGVKVPVPAVVQLPVLDPPLTVPARTTSALFAQTTWFGPAESVAGMSTVTAVVLEGLVQPATVTVTE
jgi:hypothetical protein